MKHILTLLLVAILCAINSSKAIAQVNVKDSLALIDLYISTNQPPEYHVGPVASWWGISVDSGRVIRVDFSSRTLIGTIPSSIGNLTKLKYLRLYNNKISGSLPSSIGKLIELEELFMSYNELTGSIPSTIGNLTKLRFINFWQNQLSGKIPSSMGNLTNLRALYLTLNQLTGVIPATFEHLTNLTVLYLDQNQLSGNIPPEIGNLTLYKLRLNGNHFSGAIPASFAIEKAFFHTVSLRNNNFTFDGMEELIGVNNLIVKYSPQQKIPLNFNAGKLSVSAGGVLSNDTFHWYRNLQFYKTIIGDSVLEITKNGKYFVRVNNAICTGLTLQSDTMIVTLPVTNNTNKILSDVSHKNKISFQLSPNPAKNILHVFLDNYSGNLMIKIYDTHGREIITESKTANIGKTTAVDISLLSGGIYYLAAIIKGNIVSRQKFIKE